MEVLHNLGGNEKSNKPLSLRERNQRWQYSSSILEKQVELVERGNPASKMSGTTTAHLSITAQGWG